MEKDLAWTFDFTISDRQRPPFLLSGRVVVLATSWYEAFLTAFDLVSLSSGAVVKRYTKTPRGRNVQTVVTNLDCIDWPGGQL